LALQVLEEALAASSSRKYSFHPQMFINGVIKKGASDLLLADDYDLPLSERPPAWTCLSSPPIVSAASFVHTRYDACHLTLYLRFTIYNGIVYDFFDHFWSFLVIHCMMLQ